MNRTRVRSAGVVEVSTDEKVVEPVVAVLDVVTGSTPPGEPQPSAARGRRCLKRKNNKKRQRKIDGANTIDRIVPCATSDRRFVRG